MDRRLFAQSLAGETSIADSVVALDDLPGFFAVFPRIA